MSLINQTFEYLPDIDAEIPSEVLEEIKSALSSSIPSSAANTPHASLPAAYIPKFSALIQTEHIRLASGTPKDAGTGIDSSRYESLSAPEAGVPDANAAWKAALQQAYVSHTYLSIRATNLDLLEEYGKNAWLLANSGLEAELGVLERELADVMARNEAIENERRNARVEAKAEFEVLGESWRNGVGRALETEIAAEEVRRRILEVRREGAVAG